MNNSAENLSISIRTTGFGIDKNSLDKDSLRKIEFEREAPKRNELLIDLLYCGICHSDLHLLDNSWGATLYPCIPGHEMVGRVSYIGQGVTKFQVGDVVGVGCMIDSCLSCTACMEGEENHCEGPHGPTMTYNGYLYPNRSRYNTFGGYSTNIVVREEFIVRTPPGMDIAGAAPLLCPGVATFGSLKRFMFKPGDRIGIVGIGGPVTSQSCSPRPWERKSLRLPLILDKRDAAFAVRRGARHPFGG